MVVRGVSQLAGFWKSVEFEVLERFLRSNDTITERLFMVQRPSASVVENRREMRGPRGRIFSE